MSDRGPPIEDSAMVCVYNMYDTLNDYATNICIIRLLNFLQVAMQGLPG